MHREVTLAPIVDRTLAGIREVWSRIWFQDQPTTPLEITRIGVGFALLVHYGLASPYLFTFWGDTGWLPRDLLEHDARQSVEAIGILLFQRALAVGRLPRRLPVHARRP